MEQISLQLNKVNQEVKIFSYEDNYFCADNFGQTNDPKTKPCDAVHNNEYFVRIGIIQGSMNVKVNGVEIKLKSNDHIIITPFTNVEILESRCKFFLSATKAFIALDLYTHMGLQIGVRKGCYTCHHYHLHTQQMDVLQKDYTRIKQALLKDVPIKKEDLIKARQSIYSSHVLSFTEHVTEIPHEKDTVAAKVFKQFLTLLDADYMKERSVQYYAKKIGIQAKNLSTATFNITGKTASHIIDDYVVYHIKVELYNNQLNIKEIGQKYNFPTQSFFGRYFKRVSGYSPRKYISMNSKKLAQ